MKRQPTVIIFAALLIILIIGGYFAWSHFICGPSVEQVRNMTVAYIKAHHTETAQYMQNFSWTGGNTTPYGITGGLWYSYQSTGWNVTIQYPVALPPGSMTIYSVTATYTSQVIPVEVIVSWQGTVQNGIITQTAYTFNP